MRVPGVAISNFTWDSILETTGNGGGGAVANPRSPKCYGAPTLALELPFAGGFEVSKVRRLPLVARQRTRNAETRRTRFGIPRIDPAALLSFGGYGLPTSICRAWTSWKTQTGVDSGHDRSQLSAGREPPGVIFIPESEFVRLIPLRGSRRGLDVIVTKPGYGIISECIAASRPIFYTSRGNFREYDILVRGMPGTCDARNRSAVAA